MRSLFPKAARAFAGRQQESVMMPKPFNPLTAWFETATAMNAAATTIVIRSMRMQAAMLAGDATGGPEAKTMVSEKIEAMNDGYKAALAAAPLMWAARTPQAYWNGAAGMSMAAAAPGMKKARANAKRLARGSREKP
jgi:hypothetical protein